MLIQADDRIFADVMGFVTTYPCNNSTRSPVIALLFWIISVGYT